MGAIKFFCQIIAFLLTIVGLQEVFAAYLSIFCVVLKFLTDYYSTDLIHFFSTDLIHFFSTD